MQSKLRLFGHALHPMLADFPIVTFAVLAVLDVAQAMGALDMGKVGLFLVGFGGGTAVLAILTGLVDFFAIPRQTRARKIAWWHLGGGILVWLWFGMSSGVHVGTFIASKAITVDLVGVFLVIAQSWFGGELLERHHVGVKSVEQGADPVALGRSRTRS